MNNILEALEKELKRAEEKEELAHNRASENLQSVHYHYDFGQASGYQNGIRESIDIVRRHKEDV